MYHHYGEVAAEAGHELIFGEYVPVVTVTAVDINDNCHSFQLPPGLAEELRDCLTLAIEGNA